MQKRPKYDKIEGYINKKMKSASLKKIIKILLFTFILAEVWIYLFMPIQFQKISNTIGETFFKNTEEFEELNETKIGSILSVGFAQEPETLEPTLLDPVARNRLIHIYEPLVKLDKFLRIQPALAQTWGMISETEWEFELRKNVLFHNGKLLKADDVVASFERAQQFKNSELKSLTKFMEVKAYGDFLVRIKLKKADPYLPQKVAQVLIFPANAKEKTILSAIGTGPYKFTSLKRNERLEMTRNDEYWGEPPRYKKIFFRTIPNKDSRIKELLSRGIDILADVPTDIEEKIENKDIELQGIPSLEVNFLLFNTEGIFQNKNLRKAVNYAINREEFIKLSNNRARESRQYVSKGIFGYNKLIKTLPYEPQQAKKILKDYSPFNPIKINVNLMTGLQYIGGYIKQALDSSGFEAHMNYLEPDKLEKSLKAGDGDIYFIGWKSVLGNAEQFFKNVVHSPDKESELGEFNGGNYINPVIDKQIEESTQELEDKKRIQTFQKIMKTLVEEEYFGMPLFESKNFFASYKDVHFHPRVDGIINVTEIE